MSVTTPPTTTGADARSARADDRCTGEARSLAALATRRHAHAAIAVTPIRGTADWRAWSQFADEHPCASVFHTVEWSQAVAATFGHRAHHLLAWQDERLVGVLPLFEMRTIAGSRLMVSVPYGTYGGVICESDAAAAALAAAARAVTLECGAASLELRSATALLPDFDAIDGYVTFVRTLPETPEAVGPFIPKRARAAARHARDRDGVTVTHDLSHVPLVWDMYSRSMRRLASINYPRRFFDELVRRLGPRASASIAWHQGRAVCGTLCLRHRDTVMPYILGADERVDCEGAANLLYWSAMEKAVAEGARTWDYGRSRADNRGAIGFKKNQGFEPAALGYQRFTPAGRAAPDLKPTNPRYALVRRLWPRLPLAVTRPLGAWLATYLPG